MQLPYSFLVSNLLAVLGPNSSSFLLVNKEENKQDSGSGLAALKDITQESAQGMTPSSRP